MRLPGSTGRSAKPGGLATAGEPSRCVRKVLRLCRVRDVASSLPTAIKTLLKVMGAPVKPLPRPPLQPEPLEVEEEVRRIVEEVGVKV